MDYLALILGVLGSSGLFAFITFLITRKDNSKKELNEIKERLDKNDLRQRQNELSSCRVELLIMMNHYKKDKAQILKLAERYFKDLEGDFYMTSLFAEWLDKNSIAEPCWFNDKK